MGNFEILDWDSRFFGIKIARISPDLQEEQLEMVEANLASHDVRLAYFNSTFSVPDSEFFESQLLDERVSLVKKLKNKKPWNSGIKLYGLDFLSNDMRNLSRRVAESSRFFHDERIPNSKVYEMYEIWLMKSVEKKMATEIIIYEKDDKILGFATIKGVDDQKALVPLLAVAADHEGKGISFFLMQAVETYLLENNFKYLMSETQATNKKALKVYERFGIQCDQSHRIYHLFHKL